jgi:hypothetical protein
MKNNKKSLGCLSVCLHSVSLLVGLLVLGSVLHNWIFDTVKELNIAAVISSITFIIWGGAYIFNQRIVLLSFSILPLGLALFWLQDGVISSTRRYREIHLDEEPIYFTIAIVFMVVISIVIAVWAIRTKTKTEEELETVLQESPEESLESIAKKTSLTNPEIESAINEGKLKANKDAERIMEEIAKQLELSDEERKEFEAPYKKIMKD